MTEKIKKIANRIGYSSEIYQIETLDISNLDDYEIKTNIKIKHPITVMVSENGDKLVSGRELVEQAIKDGTAYVSVQFIFKMRYPRWKLHLTLIKKLRDRKRIRSITIYHIRPQDIRALGIERAHRNQENAHQHAAAQEHPDSDNLYSNLTKSMVEDGYNDKWPMDLQLCRSLGVQDTLNQGHHRMGVMIENNIKRASVRFSAVGYVPNPFRWFLLKLAKAELKKKRENS